VKEWLKYTMGTEEKYGHISDWDVLSVTSFVRAVKGRRELQPASGEEGHVKCYDDAGHVLQCLLVQPTPDQLGYVQVTTMYCMFNGAFSFNQPLTNFDTSKVTNMY